MVAAMRQPHPCLESLLRNTERLCPKKIPNSNSELRIRPMTFREGAPGRRYVLSHPPHLKGPERNDE